MIAIAAYVVMGGIFLVMTYLVVRALARHAPDDRAVDIDAKPFPPRIRYKISARDPQLPGSPEESKKPAAHDKRKSQDLYTPHSTSSSTDTVPTKLTYSSSAQAESDDA